jgi:hypothetical protein
LQEGSALLMQLDRSVERFQGEYTTAIASIMGISLSHAGDLYHNCRLGHLNPSDLSLLQFFPPFHSIKVILASWAICKTMPAPR